MKKIIDIKKLFQEKKYTEIISQLENNIIKIRNNSGILNLLGACRLLKGKSNIVSKFSKYISKKISTDYDYRMLIAHADSHKNGELLQNSIINNCNNCFFLHWRLEYKISYFNFCNF